MKQLSEITHPELVAALVKPGEEIRASLNGFDCHLWHMASCVCGEAGELFDGIKKRVIYRKHLDVENIKEEVGDILFYLQGICQELDFTLEDAKAANISKLSKRYVGLTYSDKSAQERKDKQCPSVDCGGIQSAHSSDCEYMNDLHGDSVPLDPALRHKA